MSDNIESSIFDGPDSDPTAGDNPAPAGDQAPSQVPAGADEPQHTDQVRQSGFQFTEVRRSKRTRRTVVLLVTFGLVIGTGAIAVSALWPLVSSLTASNDYTGAGSGAVSITVHGGDSSRAIGTALEKAGVVKTARAFNDAAVANPRSGAIQPGTYALHAGMSAQSALAMLLNPVNRKVPRVTIREGLWTSEIARTLAAATGRPLAEYTAALKDPTLLGLPPQAKGDAQGYLFPSTYQFEANATAGEQLHTMVATCLAKLRQLGVTPERWQRVLTIASIAEAESRARADQPKVARVIENRLAAAMGLQLDTTVSFIAQRRGKLTTTKAQRASRSPYNTYLVKGLPPGPIDSPGLSAMQATVRPTPGPWLYFVAVNPATGETRYAVSAAGHAANVRLFQAWCRAHPGKC